MKKHIIIHSIMAISMVYQLHAVNMLQKVFVHPITQTSETLELGNIIFYFENAQVVNLLTTKLQGKWEESTYFFPMASFSSEDSLKRMVHDLNHVHHSHYRCHLKMVETPIKGLRLTISYDPNVVSVAFNTFRSLNLKEGIIFRFCNKSLLKMLQEKHAQADTVVTTAFNTHNPTIILDCGHGGDDEGAVYHSVKEKDINLAVGLRVADLLKKKGFSVVLTRDQDVTVSLSDRIACANNNKHASFFISLHANAASNQQASGIETYGMVPLLVTAENTEDHSVHHYAHARIDKSMLLAQALHASLFAYAKKGNPEVKDRSVKRAPLLVLVGTSIPAALIELGFVSHPQESALLADARYQDLLALGIVHGVCNYAQKCV